MEKLVTSSFRLGILGGGQLGKMLALKAAEWDIKTLCLDKNPDAPAKTACHELFVGDIKNYDDVLNFGKKCDVVTIESDHVNADGLEELEKMRKGVFPSSKILRVIQDKGLQRKFCEENAFPSPQYEVFDSKDALVTSQQSGAWAFPFMVKARSEGYDGKGVFQIRNEQDLETLPEGKFVAEEKIEIEKELTVLVARNHDGEIETYPVIELFMNPKGYLVDYLICPAVLPDEIKEQALQLGQSIIEKLELEGILAIEMFLDSKGRVLVNECSPRPHNSGHQTIEGSYTSQYEQHLRAILNAPLGKGEMKIPTAMINLLGDDDASGPVKYEGLNRCLKMKGVHPHIYGKQQTSPKRKMGHITILNSCYNELENLINDVKQNVKVTS